MTGDDDTRTYHDLAFAGFINLLCHHGTRAPSHIPVKLENLTDKELAVFAYLEEVSARRSDPASGLPEDPTEATTTPADTDTDLTVPVAKDREGPVEPARDEDLSEDSAFTPPSTGDHEGVADSFGGTPDLTAETDPPAPEITPQENADSFAKAAPEDRSANTDMAHEEAGDLVTVDQALASPDDLNGMQEEDGMIRGPGGIPKFGSGPAGLDPDRINLKNGRSRQPYTTLIEGYSDISVQDDGGSGLEITADGAVTGGPLAAGDYTLLLTAQMAGQPVSMQARVSIIADPRDLWKSLPSDQEAPYAKPDEDFDSQMAEAFVVAASKRGRSHAQEGKYRDDHFRIHADVVTGWHILVVADGAGSAELSREGSRIACDTVMEVLPELLADIVDPDLDRIVESHQDGDAVQTWQFDTKTRLYPVLPKASLTAARAIEKRAIEIERRPQDFATTIVIAISRRVADKWFTASFTVGDGGVALFDTDTCQVDVLCRPDSGEFAGQTRFLATDEFRDGEDVLGRVFVDLRDSFTVLAAMTDGITDPKFPTDAVFARPESWTSFWAEDLCRQVALHPQNPALRDEMLAWLDFWSRGNHDDRTIALMLPKPEALRADLGAAQSPDGDISAGSDPSEASGT